MDKWEIKKAWSEGEIQTLLEEGWEPYAVLDKGGIEPLHFFRRRIPDYRERFWGSYRDKTKQ